MAPSARIISLAEVATHSTDKSLWLVISGSVFDVTEYSHDHPGGIEIMLQHAGKPSATDAYNDIGHSNSARAILAKYKIGELSPEEAKESAEAAKVASAAHGGGNMPYVLAALVLVAALAYQFVYVPSQAK